MVGMLLSCMSFLLHYLWFVESCLVVCSMCTVSSDLSLIAWQIVFTHISRDPASPHLSAVGLSCAELCWWLSPFIQLVIMVPGPACVWLSPPLEMATSLTNTKVFSCLHTPINLVRYCLQLMLLSNSDWARVLVCECNWSLCTVATNLSTPPSRLHSRLLCS